MYRQHFDGYLNGAARGWVFDSDDPLRRIGLGIYVDDALVASGYANSFREDLLRAGVGDGSCAFALPIREDWLAREIEIRILGEDLVLPGSQRSLPTDDIAVKYVVQAKRFETYNQFSPATLGADAGKLTKPVRPSRRLTSAFTKQVGNHEGIPYTAHMEWACSRHRRGCPSFFSRQRRSPLGDLHWYLFECAEASKIYADYDFGPLSKEIFPWMPGMSHHTGIFDLWLHRQTTPRNDLRKDGKHLVPDFCAALAQTGSNLPAGVDMALPDSTAPLPPSDPRLGVGLPILTKFLYWKWTTGYREHYRLDDPRSYLAYLFDCCLHANHREFALFGEQVRSFFAHPVQYADGPVTRFALACYFFAARAAGLELSGKEISASLINKWFDDNWIPLHPVHDVFRASVSVPRSRAKCYVVANWKTPSGLTQNAQMSSRALLAAGIPVVQVMPDGAVCGTLEPKNADSVLTLSRDFVLLHVNADDAPACLYGLSGQVDLDKALVVGFFLWELEIIPAAHQLGVALVDEVWAPTAFVADAYRKLVPDKVHCVGKAISVPDIPLPDRAKFNISAETTVLLVSFDFHSSVERKNPMAAVRAFQTAFDAGDNVCLILKSTRPQPDHWGDPFDQWSQLVEAVEADSRMRLIANFLSERDMFELIACCDVVVSPHRSEGFGYLPAYGLLYGKQIVVTDYSGTKDYCDRANSIPIPFGLVNVPNGRFIYEVPGAKWAEIDGLALARGMYDAVEASRRKKASRSSVNAAKRMANHYSLPRLTECYLKRLSAAGVVELVAHDQGELCNG